MIATLLKDAYKVGHINQYPLNTEQVYSNLTARKSIDSRYKEVVVFGLQGFIKEFLIDTFNDKFFSLEKEKVVQEYSDTITSLLGKDSISFDHIGRLHDLGYLPIEIKALEEGTLCPIGIPLFTIKNTEQDFFWVTNMLETLISCELWHMITSATIAFEYRKILHRYATETSDNLEFVKFQGHDFSMRGQSSVSSATKSGAAHLLSFVGTDTIPAICYLKEYYEVCSELVGCSVPATEHSVMSFGNEHDEFDNFNRLITDIYPSGIVSIVSDTWDYFKILTETLPRLKNTILSRDGKVVIRPDSGDPYKIICGDDSYEHNTPEFKGTMQILWELFGGSINSKGYKELDSHIGVIYGDSITLDVCEMICRGLKSKGFSSTNIVYGIGSFTYQYVTRDTLGFAIKATHAIVNGKDIELFKRPKTDNGVKKSARGYLRVNEDLTLSESVTIDSEKEGLLKTVFINGKLVKKCSLLEIRDRLHKKL